MKYKYRYAYGVDCRETAEGIENFVSAAVSDRNPRYVEIFVSERALKCATVKLTKSQAIKLAHSLIVLADDM